MKQYEFLYHPVKDLTNAYSANSIPIDHKETTFPIFHTQENMQVQEIIEYQGEEECCVSLGELYLCCVGNIEA